MKHVERIPLPTGLSLDVWDASRRIAADTTRVELVIRMRVPFAADHFDEEDHYLKTRRVFGPEDFYEYRKERTFVATTEKDRVFAELLTDFKRDALPYLAREGFPRSFSQSKYREIISNLYKYKDRLESV
ncbi:MAG: hypothetical protein QM278_12455 [Pseudomonadota bacterium]|nr:hypothetical protein [Pseudomonadota bacterium]